MVLTEWSGTPVHWNLSIKNTFRNLKLIKILAVRCNPKCIFWSPKVGVSPSELPITQIYICESASPDLTSHRHSLLQTRSLFPSWELINTWTYLSCREACRPQISASISSSMVGLSLAYLSPEFVKLITLSRASTSHVWHEGLQRSAFSSPTDGPVFSWLSYPRHTLPRSLSSCFPDHVGDYMKRTT